MFPLVSIILPVYNSDLYIEECLHSILAQTYTNWELIIVNDGSTDNSKTVITDFLHKFPCKSLFFNLKHRGLPTCLNLAIAHAKGKYIARIDSDDVMLPNRLEIQVEYLEKNSHIGVLGTNAIEIDERGINLNVTNLTLENKEIKRKLTYSCPFIHPSVMMRRDICLKNRYKEVFPYPEDHELWNRLAEITDFANLSIALIKKRIHENQITSNLNRNTIYENLRLNIYYSCKKKAYLDIIKSYGLFLKLLLPISIIKPIMGLKNLIKTKKSKPSK